MDKYITVDIPKNDKNNNFLAWWVPSKITKIIEIAEEENPNYDFHQIVTSPGNGGYSEFMLMKLKPEIEKNILKVECINDKCTTNGLTLKKIYESIRIDDTMGEKMYVIEDDNGDVKRYSPEFFRVIKN